MPRRYLSGIRGARRQDLERQLWEQQGHDCYICGQHIDLASLHEQYGIDYIHPLSSGGEDGPSNLALDHVECFRSKASSDLRIARGLARFENIQRRSREAENRVPNLADILGEFGGGKHPLRLEVRENKVRYSFFDTGNPTIHESPLYRDPLSGMDYFFAVLPIPYLHYDARINPRGIGPTLKALVDEFLRKRPQLHISLGWVGSKGGEDAGKVRLFDGQHKATAQILLGVQELPVRVFLDPDLDVLLETNTNAGTILRQVPFEKFIQRHLGGSLFWDRVTRYQREHSLREDDYSFSERDMVEYFKGEGSRLRRYIMDAARDGVSHHPDNKLRDYIDLGRRASDRPLAYSTVDRTFYAFFIYQGVLEDHLGHRYQEGENLRYLEREQLVRLMNIVAEEVYVGRYDPAIGNQRIEARVQQGERVPEAHLRACRMSREEVIYGWLLYVGLIVDEFFAAQDRPINEARVLEYRFPESLWIRIRAYVRNLKQLDIWADPELSAAVFGERQKYDYWQSVFDTGHTPQGQRLLRAGLDLARMTRD